MKDNFRTSYLTSRTSPSYMIRKALENSALYKSKYRVIIRIFSSLSSSHHLSHHRIVTLIAFTALYIINHLSSVYPDYQIKKQISAFDPLRIKRLDECLCRKMI